MNKWALVGLIAALWAPGSWAQFGMEEELLPAEQAFAFRAEAKDAQTITAHWTIAEGYYLYRSRIQFATDTAGVSLGEAVLPPGKIKQDEFFGQVETYRHELSVDVPVSGDVSEFVLTARSQGCADIGVCYPPQTQSANIQRPTAGQTGAVGGALAALSQLGSRLGLGQDEEFLDPDQAFQFDSELDAAGNLLARWNIAEGYYLYREKIQFQLPDGAPVTLGEATYPAGEIKEDEFFGRMEVYHDPIEVTLPLARPEGASGDSQIRVTYQGCADAGICYPPQTKTVPLPLALLAGAAQAAPTEMAAGAPITEQDRIAQRLSEGSALLTILSFFGFGLLLAFTPCVFPMIPILSSIIVGQGEKITTQRAFVLSLIYVLAMALTYTAAGVIAGLFGENLQAAFQNAWILGSFAAVFVLLSFSMFGFYELEMPKSVQDKLSEVSNRQEGGTFIGVAIMGFLSALIVGPCVAAPLAGALIYIGQSGDPVLGGMALFALSLGMGAPLVVIGTGAGKLMPRAGGWMNIVKGIFGVLLLAVALWMLERIIPAAVAMGLWGLLLIVSAIYMGALDSTGPDATGWHRFWKGLGLAMLVYGTLLLIGAAAGSDDRMQPLAGLTSGTAGSTVQAEAHPFQQVRNPTELDTALAQARADGRPVLLDFYADWCVDCKRLEKYTFSKPEVQTALGNTLLLQADVTDNNTEHKALLKRFGLIGPPSVLFFDRQGQELRPYRLVGFLNAKEFRAHVERLPR